MSIVESESIEASEDLEQGFAELTQAAAAAERGDELPPVEPSEAVDAPARDEQGRFVAKAEAESTGDPITDHYLAKFDGDLMKAVKSAAHQEELFGRQTNELGELRRVVEERLGQPQQPVQQQAPSVPLTQETVDWFDEQVEQNPQGAAVWAAQSDPSGVLYNRAMDAWYEMQPRQAAQFERQLEIGQIAQAFDQRLSTVTGPLEAQAHQNDFVSAWNAVAQRLPNLSEHSEAILEAAQSAPEVVTLLQSGTLDDKKRVIENLYYLARGRQADTLTEVAQEMATRETEEARLAKQRAAVAIASSTGPGGESATESLASKLLGGPTLNVTEGLTFGK